ncbi:MAG: YitT family protein [Ruminococcaceae bacterium]|nr:YitT family protein [Oscillospiraceae bacterium]
MERSGWKSTLADFAVITAGTAIIAAAVFFFLTPSHLALGSVAGLAIVLTNFIPLSVSAISLIVNVGLLVVGFLLIGREFGAKTVYTSVILPVFIGVLERLFPDVASLTQDALSDLACYLFIVSLGQAILFRCNASSGGLDIVGKLLNKFFHIELGRAISMAGLCVALSAAFAYDVRTVLLSLLGTYLNGIVLDHFLFNSTLKKRVCILSQKQDEMIRYITTELHSGATIYEATGAFTDEKKKEVITIVNMQEYRKLMDFIGETDPTAFITVYNVSEVVYRPKKRG